MKAKMIRVAVVLALLVSLFAIAAPPVFAADLSPNYGTISATTGQVGDTVTIIGTAGVNAWPLNNVALEVKWYETSTSSAAVATIPAVPISDKDDGFYSLSFKVPATANGNHKVRVTDGITTADLAAFTINSKVTISPSSGAKGTEVTVTASGFTKNQGLTIYDDTDDDGDIDSGTLAVRATLNTDAVGSAYGTFSGTTKMMIVARDGAGVVYEGTGQVFTVNASLALTPDSGLVGTKVEVKGSEFGTDTNEALTAITEVRFGGTLVDHEVTNLEANLGANEYILKTPVSTDSGEKKYTSPAAGKFTLLLLLPGNAPAGVNQIKVTTNADVGDPDATANFTVTARSLTLSPSSGVIGNSVLATAAGFSKSTSGGQLSYTSGTLVTAITTDASGGASASFTVPSGFAVGSNTVTFTDGNSNTATATFTVTEASITISPIEGPPGTSVTIAGTAFAGNSLVTITFTPVGGSATLVPTTPSTVVTNSMGSFSATLIAPSSGVGAASVTATVSAVSKSKDFSVKAAVETVATVLEPIADKFTIVWGFDAATQTWMKYDPTAPAVSDLAKLEKGKGYWIYVTEATTLVWSAGVYNLPAGWNLIGWLG